MLAVGIMMVCATVNAQIAATSSADQTGENSLQEVIVTAQFRKERLQDAPLAITALNAASLEQKGTTDLVGAGNLAPNVSLSSGSSVGAFGQMASVFIRGVGQSDPHFAVEPGVGIYIDDVYYGVTPGAVFQLLDTDRVEIARGPQGTLSGKNSIGGSIKLYSKQPGPAEDAFIEAFYGSYNKVGGRGAGNLTLIDDHLFARLSVAGIRSDGYMDRLDYGCVTGSSPTSRLDGSCKLGTEGGQDTVTAKGALRWVVTDHLEDTLLVDIVQDNSENPALKQITTSPLWAGANNYITCSRCYTNYDTFVSRPVSGPSAGSSFTMPSTTPWHGWGASNKLHLDISDSLRLDSITAERQSTVVFVSPVEATPASVSDQVWRLRHSQFTQEIRLSGEYQHLLEWTVGGFYYDARGTSGGRVNIPFGLSPGGGDLGLGIADDILFNDPVHTKNESGFIHTTWHPVDNLGITLDGRYSHDSKLFTFYRWNSLGQPNPAIPGLLDLPVAYSGNRFDYRAGVDYKWTSDLMTYTQISTGYKGGGPNPRPFFASQATTYNPETLRAYEVGVKSQWFDHALTANIAGFFDDYSKFQGTLTSCNAYSPFPGAPCDMTANVGNAHISGVEFESALHVARGLSVDASVGWLNFKYTSVDAATGIKLSDTNVYTPKLTANAGIQYEASLGNLGTITPRVDFSYRSQMYTNFVNDATNRVAAVGLVNAKAGWMSAHGDWEATVVVTNLMNRFYYRSVFDPDAPPPALQLYGSIVGIVGAPREFLITVRRNFGH